MTQTYNIEELLNEIYNNYHSVTIKALGNTARTEIRLKDTSDWSEIHIQRIGDLANVVIFVARPKSVVLTESLSKANYEAILTAVFSCMTRTMESSRET